jgi:hypothetical protein
MRDDDFTVPPNATMEEKLDLALFWLASMAKQQVQVNKLEERVSALESKIASQDATINILVKENKASKEMVNSRDQESRGNTIRLFGLPVSQDETSGTKPLSNIVYDRILKPILTAARTKGDIPTVPHAANLIDECYRSGRQAAGPSASDVPPPPSSSSCPGSTGWPSSRTSGSTSPLHPMLRRLQASSASSLLRT